MTARGRRGCLAALAVTLACAPAAASPALAARFGPDDRETLMLSRSAGGLFPNGPSSNAAISGDYQLASLAAYDSEASDIVAGDSNGFSDVFLVRRARPYSIDGEPWRPGRTRIVSRGRSGGQANGPSYLPDLAGDRHHRPRCIAFVSRASNLVRGDTNGVADAFVQDLRTRRTVRVSVSSRGRQSNGETTEAQVDGGCTRVAFVSSATDLGLRRAGARTLRGLASSRPRTGRPQVYMRVLNGARPLRGVTFLASASAGGRAGNGASTEVSLARLSGRSGPGAALAYSSKATNLGGRDRNRASDVYLTRLVRRHGSYRRVTRLVSRRRSGAAGNGASDQPEVVAGGAVVIFRTQSTDLLRNDGNAVADIARATTAHAGRFDFVSRSRALGQNANGASSDPTSVEPGTNVFFESEASNLQATTRGSLFDRNDAGDVFFWSALSGNVSLQSRDSHNEILNNRPGHAGPDPGEHIPQAPAANPAASYYGNYVLFESPYPLVDLDISSRSFPSATERDAARYSHELPFLRQVYLRYIGPR
jgi:hypothetical protein